MSNTKGRAWPVRAAVLGMVAVIAAVFASGNAATDDRAAAQIEPVSISLSAEEETQWRTKVATPAGRAQVMEAIESSFGGLLSVGVGDRGAHDAAKIERVAFSTGLPIRPEWATGITGDHFWIIASYADINGGAVSGAVKVCKTRVPGWLCDAAGRLLREWANGWGWAHNHGVWAAVYWWPPRVTGGRW